MMSFLTLPVVWFAAGAYLFNVLVLVLLVSLMSRFRKYRTAGTVALTAGLLVVPGALVLGDWSVAECYTDGKFMADDVKCIFP